MQATHYALAALARDLDRPFGGGGLVGARLADAFSQQPGELRLVFVGESADGVEAVRTLIVGTKPAFAFVAADASRPRRNVATRFEAWHGRRVTAVHVATRDRLLTVDLGGGVELVGVLFGPRANVVVTEPEDVSDGVDESPRIVADAFLAPSARIGTAAPVARPAPLPATVDAFAARLPLGGTDAARVRRAWPLFDDLLATEALARAASSALSDPEAALFAACEHVHADALAAAAPSVLWRGTAPVAASLIALSPGVANAFADALLGAEADENAVSVRVEAFSSTSDALRVFARRRFAQASFAARRATFATRLDAAIETGQERVERMLTEMSRPSRADDLERDGHLLMAHPGAAAPGADRVVVPDLLGDGSPREIRLDPALGLPANAAERYARARRLRAARAHAETRLVDADAALTDALALRRALDACTDIAALDAFARDAEAALARIAPPRRAADERLPYTIVPLGRGYEAWVARSAADGDALTRHHARPFDLWMHARGVTGAHVVVRLRGRQDVLPKDLVERAAALAAFASKSRTSALAPVTVTTRKWVRKRKGDPPGRVVVEREDVLIVAPRGPDGG